MLSLNSSSIFAVIFGMKMSQPYHQKEDEKIMNERRKFYTVAYSYRDRGWKRLRFCESKRTQKIFSVSEFRFRLFYGAHSTGKKYSEELPHRYKTKLYEKLYLKEYGIWAKRTRKKTAEKTLD